MPCIPSANEYQWNWSDWDHGADLCWFNTWRCLCFHVTGQLNVPEIHLPNTLKNDRPSQALCNDPRLTVRAINLANTPKIWSAFRADRWPGTTDSGIGEEFYIQQHKLRINLVRLLSFIQLERGRLVEKPGATHNCRCLDSLFT